MRTEEEERRKRFFPTITLGNFLAGLAIVGSALGVYNQLYADVRDNKAEITLLKRNEATKNDLDKESRREIKEEIKEVKGDVKEMRNDVQKILLEINRVGREGRDRETRGRN